MTMKGFIIFDDYAHRYEEFATDMQKWVQEGKLSKEQLIEGLESAPEGLNDVWQGVTLAKWSSK